VPGYGEEEDIRVCHPRAAGWRVLQLLGTVPLGGPRRQVDVVVASAVAYELSDAGRFFAEVRPTLARGAPSVRTTGDSLQGSRASVERRD
jgi:hypothetical protein